RDDRSPCTLRYAKQKDVTDQGQLKGFIGNDKKQDDADEGADKCRSDGDSCAKTVGKPARGGNTNDREHASKTKSSCCFNGCEPGFNQKHNGLNHDEIG